MTTGELLPNSSVTFFDTSHRQNVPAKSGFRESSFRRADRWSAITHRPARGRNQVNPRGQPAILQADKFHRSERMEVAGFRTSALPDAIAVPPYEPQIKRKVEG